MQFKFKKLKSTNGLYEHYLIPYLMVELSNYEKNYRSVTVNALIDSGADQCIINCGYAETLLNKDYTSGIKVETKGVVGDVTPVYFHTIKFKIKDFPNSEVDIPFGFINSRNVDVLLGRHVFFEKFKITFEQQKGNFDIELMP